MIALVLQMIYSKMTVYLFNNKIMLNKGQSSREAREFRKSGCQLQEFPLIKLHIFSDIEVLDLSDNLISDLSTLQPHAGTAPHVLSKLKVVNLSQNQFPNAAALFPLAQAAKNITSLNVSYNPLVQNLNFLYQLVIQFEKVERINCGYEVQVDEGVRREMVKQQLGGGRIISSFLMVIQQESRRGKNAVNLREEKELLEKMLKQLGNFHSRITQQNDLIFQTMDKYINFCIRNTTPASNSPTYRSPQRYHYSSHEIEMRSEYQIGSPNQLLKYLTEGDEQMDLIEFYYQEMVKKPAISGKILLEIEVEESVLLQIEEGRRAIPPSDLLHEMKRKWVNNLVMTTKIHPALTSHHISSQSPFKSIQTDITAHLPPLSSHTNDIYFGLDRQWTHETLQYLKHRLMSILRSVIQAKPVENKYQQRTFQQNYTSPPRQISTSPRQIIPSTFSSRDENYQTFGLSFEFPLKEKNLSSPKSRNKFIIGSLINVLQTILKRIVFRRISNARFIQHTDIVGFTQIIGKIIKKSQEFSMRKIYETAVFYECLQERMDAFKKKTVFRAWKQLKKRKMKLLKHLLLRKSKKQNALLSVFFAQMRLSSSNIGLQRRVQRSREEMLTKSNELQDLSCILKRSATCQKSLIFQNRPKDSDRTIQARRNCLKRSLK